MSLQRLPSRKAVFDVAVEGAELLVLDGEIQVEGEAYTRGAWLRLPKGEYPEVAAGADGATIYLKLGRLPEPAMGT